MDFQTRFQKLNDNQKKAVEHIDGPLLVIAGPGTGKTELLSMRAAEILRQTDTLPSSILCLTFTESGAANMRERLRQIIGEDAYKVAIHTFHSFGVEIINQNSDYFFRGGEFKPADELAQYQILRGLFDALDWNHPLAGKNGDDYTHLSDVMTLISEFKKSGLSGDELRQIIQSNLEIIDVISAEVTTIFAGRISKSTIELFAPLAEKIAAMPAPKLPAGISSYAGTLALSIAHAAQEAIESDSTKPITAWKNTWCEKDEQKNTVLKDARHTEKLLAATKLYDQYEAAMQIANLYDYDDMILNVIKAVESHTDLQANLQEKFQYIMVDEFQDTNLAQLRLLFSLAEGEKPNVMAVGDDDQAIFSFQGADIGNIQRFREKFQDLKIIVLTDNYRSVAEVLSAARKVITQGEDRLENTIPDLSKELTPWFSDTEAKVSLSEFNSVEDERMTVAQNISELLKRGVPAENIAVLARRHHELIDILPYFAKHNILVNYERRDNTLEHEIVKVIELLARVIVANQQGKHDEANALLPELVAQPAFGFSAHDIWKLSLDAWRNHTLWLETMQTNTTFKPFADWLIQQSIDSVNLPLEQQIDSLIGKPEDYLETQSSNLVIDSVQRLQPEHEVSGAKRGVDYNGRENAPNQPPYASPLYSYYFSTKKLTTQPDLYLDTLEALRTLRDKLREHFSTESPKLAELLSFIDLYRQTGATLTIVRRRADHQQGQINLMTAHKSKGLEFEHVFVIGAIDSAWGEKVRSRSRLIRYPVNLPLQPAGSTFDERLRLFFVAMTRAKKTLRISFSNTDASGKSTLVASFLSGQPSTVASTDSHINQALENAEIDWRGRLVKPISDDLRTLLASNLETYKLSATHLNNFLDVSRGGPQTFLLNNLLRFPQGKSAAASYGTAIHATLQQTHNAVRIDKKLPQTESILENFTRLLTEQHLSADDFATYSDKGRTALTAFLAKHSENFTDSQITELSFSSQGAVVGEARLTGALDLADIDKTDKTIRVTDYKTGKPSDSWKGKTDYEKIKLHKYRQQLMFYQLLVENSRDYSDYSFEGGVLQFVEPDMRTGEILALEDSFSEDDLARFRQLISVIWQKIITLDLPDISSYDPSYKGMLQFEEDLLGSY